MDNEALKHMQALAGVCSKGGTNGDKKGFQQNSQQKEAVANDCVKAASQTYLSSSDEALEVLASKRRQQPLE